MKIVLLGYMGSGKTTIGNKVANKLKFDFLDLDDYIIESEEMAIHDIFKERGELYFRKKENAYLNEILSTERNLVLSTGGGTPCYGKNMETILKYTQNAIYLRVSIKELAQRLSKEKQYRPLIKNIADDDLPEFVGKHLFERSFFYTQAAHTIMCDNKEPEDIVREIEALVTRT